MSQSNSGATASQPITTEATITAPNAPATMAPGSALQSFFSRSTPDASPGRNTLTINGLPAGTRTISVWMTEWVAGNAPHAGAAFFYTTSVQLYNNGTQCRVIYNLDWNNHLPAGCSVIYGPG